MRLQGLLEFLAHEPYYARAHWNHLLLKPLEQHGSDGALPLMQLLKGVMLRRTKRHVGEQPDEYQRWLCCSPDELQLVQQGSLVWLWRNAFGPPSGPMTSL